MQYNPSRYEVDKKTGFFTIGYGAGSSPTFTNLTVTNNGTFGGNLTVSGGKVLISYPSSNQARVSFGGAHFDANSSYASYIRGYSSSATTAGLDFYTTYGSSVLALSLSEQGNATIAGNLTVSGGTITGGTSGLSLASGGTNQSITLTPSGTGKVSLGLSSNTVQFSSGAATITPNLVIGANAGKALSLGAGSNGASFGFDSSGYFAIAYDTRANIIANGYGTNEALRVTGSGNLLIGTTSDSGNGKLQLATHTTSAGGIGFGTDVSLYRAGVNTLNLDTTQFSLIYQPGAASLPNMLRLINNRDTLNDSWGLSVATPNYYKFRMLVTNTNAGNGEGSVAFQTGTAGGTPTTALTLDSSQNATFAGRVATGGAASIGVAVSTGLGLNVNLDPGTLTYGAANAWLGARIRPARAGTTGNAFAISGQLEVTSGTQTKAATIIAEAPSGTLTNHTYFYANSSGSRVAPTGNYSLYAESTAGPAYIGDATASTSTTTGALQVAGGVGVAGAVNVGGAIAIGNTVQTAAAVASTHKVTISIGGSTYYLLATNV